MALTSTQWKTTKGIYDAWKTTTNNLVKQKNIWQLKRKEYGVNALTNERQWKMYVIVKCNVRYTFEEIFQLDIWKNKYDFFCTNTWGHYIYVQENSNIFGLTHIS